MHDAISIKKIHKIYSQIENGVHIEIFIRTFIAKQNIINSLKYHQYFACTNERNME